jgi:hypothetical protein
MVRRDGSDEPLAMNYDLRTILDGWDYEPGKISVRKIIGDEGREKVQTRVDLGVLQLELTGRPDGLRPGGRESILDCCEARLTEYRARRGGDAGFELTQDECRDLRHETHLYYQRFLALFVLEDFDAVERDALRNLRALDLCRRYGPSEHDRTALEPQRAYLIMMQTRARAYLASQHGEFDVALRSIDTGAERIRDVYEQIEDAARGESSPELSVLETLHQELLEKMPPDAAPRLRWQLASALQEEDYETAARLRDRLARLEHPHESA